VIRMSRRSLRSRLQSGLGKLAVSLALLALVGGCGGDPIMTERRPVGDHAYPPPDASQANPEATLQTFRAAYERRDSLAFRALYDSSYVGETVDLNGLPESLVFSRADELAHIAALARRSSISSVTCALGASLAWTRLPSDQPAHPERAVIQLRGENVRVEIVDGETMLEAGGPSETMTFRFAPHSPASSSPTDTIWKIVGWTEVRSSL
jgi:hypothetical protein